LCGLDSAVSGYDPVAGFRGYGNRPSGVIKAGHFLTSWATVEFLNKTLYLGVG
jgi:hypothetical protein